MTRTLTLSFFALVLAVPASMPASALAAPPSLDAIDVREASAGTRVRLSGRDLGDPAIARVEIGGVPAPTAAWTDTAITAYVPAHAAPGDSRVRVVTPEGTAELALRIVAPAPVGDRIAWRIVGEGNAPARHAPAVRSDGSLLVSDQAGFVYAIDHDGAVRWVVDAARMLGVEWAQADRGPIAIGEDDVAYVAVTSGTRQHLLALDHDGELAWARTLEGGFLAAGPSIGPEGDVYVLHTAAWIVSTDDPGPSQGMMRLRREDGSTVWANRGAPVMVQVPFEGAPIAFGASSPGGAVDRAFVFTDQRALSTSPGDPQLDAVRAFSLDEGREVFVTATRRPNGSASPAQVWPAVRDDGVVLVSSFVSAGEGTRVRFLDPTTGEPTGTTSAGATGGLGSPLAGRDGRAFVVRDQSWLDAFDAGGHLLWERRITGSPRPNRAILADDRGSIWVPSVGRAIRVAAEDGALTDDVSVPPSQGTDAPLGCALGVDDTRARAYFVGCFADVERGWELSAIDLAREAAPDAGVADAGAPAIGSDGGSDGGVSEPGAPPGRGGCSVGADAPRTPWLAAIALAAALATRRRRR